MSQTGPGGGVARRRDLPILASSVAAGFVCWAAWMGWDLFYDTDPMTGESTGPYEPWQSLGSALSLLAIVLFIGATRRSRTAAIAFGFITTSYTVGFCVSAVISSELNPDGGASLWPIGAVFLMLGVGTGVFAVGGLVILVRAVGRRLLSR